MKLLGIFFLLKLYARIKIFRQPDLSNKGHAKKLLGLTFLNQKRERFIVWTCLI